MSKSAGGLGQIDIAAQYRAFTGSLVVWVTRPCTHPLRSILRGHINQLSHRRWGTEDLSWIVSQSGSLTTKGSSTWRNICRSWQGLKPHIKARRPVNISEWRELPLWRPHVNHISPSGVRCNTQAQKTLRDCDLTQMDDVMALLFPGQLRRHVESPLGARRPSQIW